MSDQAQTSNQPQLVNMNQNQNQMLNLSQQQPMMNHPLQQSQMLMNAINQPQQPPMKMPSQGMSRSYGMWGPLPPIDQLKFSNPLPPPPAFGSSKPLGRSSWKGKKGSEKRQDGRRKEKPIMTNTSGAIGVVGVGGSAGYQPPTLKELQHQNRLKARRFFPKKKFGSRSAPFAPRNTTSFIIRAKKSGGIASLVSPSPVTPAVLPTPIFSPSREVLVDMAKEEWGVDGYGSMKGLIRLRSPGNEADGHDDDEEEDGGSSESDVEEHVEVERRLDHDLSRFEMIYPNCASEYSNCLENRVDDQDTHIAHLEEENLILKERLFLMEREFGELRRRLQSLERRHRSEEANEEVMENESDNESEDSRSMEENNELEEEKTEGKKDVKPNEDKIRIMDPGVKPESECENIDVNKEKCHEKIVAKEEHEDIEGTDINIMASENGGARNFWMEKNADGGDKQTLNCGSKDEGAGSDISDKSFSNVDEC